MYLYIYIHTRVYICVHTHTHTHTYIYIYIYICICVYTYYIGLRVSGLRVRVNPRSHYPAFTNDQRQVFVVLFSYRCPVRLSNSQAVSLIQSVLITLVL